MKDGPRDELFGFPSTLPWDLELLTGPHCSDPYALMKSSAKEKHHHLLHSNLFQSTLYDNHTIVDVSKFLLTDSLAVFNDEHKELQLKKDKAATLRKI